MIVEDNADEFASCSQAPHQKVAPAQKRDIKEDHGGVYLGDVKEDHLSEEVCLGVGESVF